MYYKVSKKEMAQLALNSLKEILKRRKSISDLLVMALPERVVAGLSTPSSSSMNARMTSLDQCNHFHSPHITAAFASTVVVFITIVVITV